MMVFIGIFYFDCNLIYSEDFLFFMFLENFVKIGF